jgi:hypothetical protein
MALLHSFGLGGVVRALFAKCPHPPFPRRSGSDVHQWQRCGGRHLLPRAARHGQCSIQRASAYGVRKVLPCRGCILHRCCSCKSHHHCGADEHIGAHLPPNQQQRASRMSMPANGVVCPPAFACAQARAGTTAGRISHQCIWLAQHICSTCCCSSCVGSIDCSCISRDAAVHGAASLCGATR